MSDNIIEVDRSDIEWLEDLPFDWGELGQESFEYDGFNEFTWWLAA